MDQLISTGGNAGIATASALLFLSSLLSVNWTYLKNYIDGLLLDFICWSMGEDNWL